MKIDWPFIVCISTLLVIAAYFFKSIFLETCKVLKEPSEFEIIFDNEPSKMIVAYDFEIDGEHCTFFDDEGKSVFACRNPKFVRRVGL